MAIIKPFKGVRPQPKFAKQVASKPYDVLNTEEARGEVEGNPYSFLHVIRSEIDLPEGTDPYRKEVYEMAKQNFDHLLKEGILVQDEQPTLYIYSQKMGIHEQTGLVACSSVADYFNDVIKKHEYTRPVKEQDRINHIKTTGIHSGPVFITYPDVKSISTIIKVQQQEPPVYEFTADDGVNHKVWVIDEKIVVDELTGLFSSSVPFTYIADGHHRAASSAKVGKELASNNPNHKGTEDYNYFLSVLFPASELNIIDYNRVVKDLNGLSVDEFITSLSDSFTVEPQAESFKPQAAREFGMYLSEKWYALKAKPSIVNDDDPVESLDVSILSRNVLDPILGIKDQRTDDRIDFVGGIRGLGELQKRVDNGEMKVAFAIYPVTIEQLISIADSGNVMPPKSTWFEPKLRSGLVVHKFL